MTAGDGDGARADRPILGVGGLVFDGTRVLLVKRGAHPAKGFWSIPGGKLRAGEALKEAVKREVLEETGLRVQVGALVEVHERLPRSDPRGRDGHFVVLDYLCQLAGGQLQAGDDADEARWFPVDRIDGLRLTPGAAKVVRKAFSLRMDG